jgi:hypothetical protein
MPVRLSTINELDNSLLHLFAGPAGTAFSAWMHKTNPTFLNYTWHCGNEGEVDISITEVNTIATT